MSTFNNFNGYIYTDLCTRQYSGCALFMRCVPQLILLRRGIAPEPSVDEASSLSSGASQAVNIMLFRAADTKCTS